MYWMQLAIGLGKVQWSSLGMLILTLLSQGSLAGAVLLGGTELQSGWSWTAGMAVGAVMLGVAGRVFCTGDAPARGIGPRMGRALSFGLQAYFGEIAGQIWSRLDSWILAYYAGPQVLGIYSVAAMVAERYRLSVGPIRNALARDIAGTTLENSWAILMRTTWVIGLPLLAIGLLAGLGSFIAFPVIFGAQFEAAALPFLILVGGSWAAAVCSFGAPFFVGQLRRPFILSVVAWSMVGLELVLCVALIPRKGMEGAATAAALTMAAGAAAIYLLGHRSVRGHVAAPLPRPEDRP
jgi:O-antigen/teichoic acid export membrane protein